MDKKADKVLLEANIILRAIALGNDKDKVMQYRAHKLSLEINEFRFDFVQRTKQTGRGGAA